MLEVYVYERTFLKEWFCCLCLPCFTTLSLYLSVLFRYWNKHFCECNHIGNRSWDQPVVNEPIFNGSSYFRIGFQVVVNVSAYTVLETRQWRWFHQISESLLETFEQTLAYVFRWSMLFAGLCYSLAYVFRWPMLFAGLCFSLAYVFRWPMLLALLFN